MLPSSKDCSVNPPKKGGPHRTLTKKVIIHYHLAIDDKSRAVIGTGAESVQTGRRHNEVGLHLGREVICQTKGIPISGWKPEIQVGGWNLTHYLSVCRDLIACGRRSGGVLIDCQSRLVPRRRVVLVAHPRRECRDESVSAPVLSILDLQVVHARA